MLFTQVACCIFVHFFLNVGPGATPEMEEAETRTWSPAWTKTSKAIYITSIPSSPKLAPVLSEKS